MSARPKPPASVARAEIARLAAVGVNPVAKAPRLNDPHVVRSRKVYSRWPKHHAGDGVQYAGSATLGAEPAARGDRAAG
jgi:hypothetical protein